MKSWVVATLFLLGCVFTLGFLWRRLRPLRPGEVYAKRYRLLNKIYHAEGCRYGRMITRAIRFASWQEAEQAGYRACGICQPRGSYRLTV